MLQEYILQGVVHAALGQQKQDAEMVKSAQQFFQLVGASASECDTIPGRQCMASCFHLLGQFDDVLIFLNSILQVRSVPAGCPCSNAGVPSISSVCDRRHSYSRAVGTVCVEVLVPLHGRPVNSTPEFVASTGNAPMSFRLFVLCRSVSALPCKLVLHNADATERSLS